MAVASATRALLLPLLLGLPVALLVLGLGAAPSSVSEALSASRPSAAAAGSSSPSRAVPHPGAAARLQRTPASVLNLSAPPVRRHVLALAVAPARRRLLAYPDEPLGAHGAGGPAAAASPTAPPAAADCGHGVSLSRRATSSGAGAAAATVHNGVVLEMTVEATTGAEYGWVSLSASASPPQPGAAALLQPTPASPVADPASPAPRHVLALPAASPGLREEEDPAASPASAAPPSGADAGREVPLPPRPTSCTFVTHIGGATETIHRGDGRVYVVQEFTGAANASAPPNPIGFGLESLSDDDDDDDDDDYSDSDSSDDDDNFSKYMNKFCGFVEYVSDTYDVLEVFI